MTKSIAVGVLAAAVLLESVGAQQETFDVAVVKKSRSQDVTPVVPGVFLPGGRWLAQRATLAMLLRSAYAIPSDRIVGMPSWAHSERFTIEAKAADPIAPQTRLRMMAQRLLVERFRLRAHMEQRTDEVYALIRAVPSGPLGPGLRPSAASCRSAEPAQGTNAELCRERMTIVDTGALRYELRDRSLQELLTLASADSETGRHVVDRTGLAGRFDIDLEFVPQTMRMEQPGIQGDPTTLKLGVPLAVAVINQLGLRFGRFKEPVDVLVVEGVTMPSVD